MIGFVTLFLGVFFGIREVEVAPAAEVARVEMRLDDAVVATLEKPPWKANVDFGANPLPRLLVAVARAADGRELGRAEQWVNRPTPMASASLSLVPGEPPAVRLSWEAVTAAQPERLTVTCDGQPLDVSDPARIPFPKTALVGTKLVRALLEFPGDLRASAEVLLGTGVRDSADTALTAVLVTVTKGELPAPAALHGFFEAEGKPLEVVAWEKGPAEVLVVVERSAQVFLQDPGPSFWRATYSVDLATATKLPDSVFFRVVFPLAEETASRTTRYRLFATSPRYTSASAGILSAVMSLGPPPVGSGKPLVRAAVAASGLDLAGGPTRRAVILLLGPYPKDASELPDEGLRRYLEALEVPYRVLRLGRANPKGWGSVADAFTLRLLEAAVFQVGEDLERQRVVWIAGHHRPGSIRLGRNSKELAWAR